MAEQTVTVTTNNPTVTLTSADDPTVTVAEATTTSEVTSAGTDSAPFKNVLAYADLPTAITAMAAGDHLMVVAGTYPITASLTPGSSTHIEFLPGAQIQVPAGCTFHAINVTGKSNVTLTNPRIVKASGAAALGTAAGINIAAGSTDITVVGGDVSEMGRGYNVDGESATVEEVTLRDCTARDSSQFGFALGYCDVVALANIRSFGSGLDGVKALAAADNVTLDGFYLSGALGGDGIDTYGGGGTWQIVNGTAKDNSLSGIVVKSSARNSTKDATITEADDLFTCTSHQFANNLAIRLTDLTGGDGLAEGTTYYTRDATANTFKVSATLGGAAINVTADGTASFREVGLGYMESLQIDNVRCIDNGGYGFSIHRDAGDSATDHTDEPLPSHIQVGSVIVEGSGAYGVYVRANNVQIAQIISNGNGAHGIVVDGACIDVQIGQWYAAGNGTSLTNTYDGCHVEGGLRIRIGGGTAMGAWVQGTRSETDNTNGTATQRYGLRIASATTSIVAAAPMGANNVTALYSDQGADNMEGFYGTLPLAKQTGVAETAEGIHAALVALGLISA